MTCLITNASLLVAVRRLSVSVFVALSLLLAACGGGGAGADSSRLDNKLPNTEKPSGETDTVDNGVSNDDSGNQSADEEPVNDNPNANVDNGSDDSANPDGGNSVTDGTGGNSSKPGTSVPDSSDDSLVDGGDASEPDAGVDQPNDDSGLLDEIVSEVSGVVRLEWQIPEFRENGESLPWEEIGGYELRYRSLTDENFQTVIITDGDKENYDLGKLEGKYQFSIATFDTNGLYSEFVSLSPVTGLLGSI